jgi:nitrate/nitrite transporter NarK
MQNIHFQAALHAALWHGLCICQGVLVRPTNGNKADLAGGFHMRYLKFAALVGILALVFGAAAGTANAQVRVGVGIGLGAPVPPPAYVGAEPACAYGY